MDYREDDEPSENQSKRTKAMAGKKDKGLRWAQVEETAKEAKKNEKLKETEEVEQAEKPEETALEEEVLEEAEEIEEKVARAKKKEKEEDIVEEKVYTVPLGRAWISTRRKRAPRAMRLLKGFIQRHMKIKIEPEEAEVEAERLVVSNEVNEKIWSRGIEKPPRKIRIRAVKDKEGVITVYLAEG